MKKFELGEPRELVADVNDAKETGPSSLHDKVASIKQAIDDYDEDVKSSVFF